MTTKRDDGGVMRALTIHQPWAWAICHADKSVENRTQAPPRVVIGHDFAVHAGLTVDEEAWISFREGGYGSAAERVPEILDLVRGAIVGVSHLEGYSRTRVGLGGLGRDGAADERWFAGPVGNLLGNRRPLVTPIRCRGRQGWWPLPPDIEARVRRQLEAV